MAVPILRRPLLLFCFYTSHFLQELFLGYSRLLGEVKMDLGMALASCTDVQFTGEMR